MKTMMTLLAAALLATGPFAFGDNYDGVTALMKERQYKPAKVIVEAELKKDNPSPKWKYAMGYILEMQGRKSEAAKCYAEAALQTKKSGADLQEGSAAAVRFLKLRPEMNPILNYAKSMEEVVTTKEGKEASMLLYEYVFNPNAERLKPTTVFPSRPVFGASQVISKDCKYTCSSPPHAQFGDNGGTQLTNGEAPETTWGESVGIAVGWSKVEPEIIVDLGGRRRIDSARVYVAGNGFGGINAPESIRCFVSRDGRIWRDFGEAKDIPNQSGWVDIKPRGRHSSRLTHVKFEFTQRINDRTNAKEWLGLAEIEIKGAQ